MLSQFQNSICQKIFDPKFFFQHMIFDTQKNIFDLKKIFLNITWVLKMPKEAPKWPKLCPAISPEPIFRYR